MNLTLTFKTDNAFRSSPRSDPPIDWGFFKECQCTGVYEGCSDCRVAKANDGSGAECRCLSAHISDTIPDLVYQFEIEIEFETNDFIYSLQENTAPYFENADL